jgi:hypothetical protein
MEVVLAPQIAYGLGVARPSHVQKSEKPLIATRLGCGVELRRYLSSSGFARPSSLVFVSHGQHNFAFAGDTMVPPNLKG